MQTLLTVSLRRTIVDYYSSYRHEEVKQSSQSLLSLHVIQLHGVLDQQ